jgi:hypothetical protein
VLYFGGYRPFDWHPNNALKSNWRICGGDIWVLQFPNFGDPSIVTSQAFVAVDKLIVEEPSPFQRKLRGTGILFYKGKIAQKKKKVK